MTEREIYEKFSNISEQELNTKSNINFYVINVVMNAIIKCCRGEKNRSVRAIDRFRKKLLIPDSQTPECPEFEVKSKIRKYFMNGKVLEEYSVMIYEIDPFFMRITKKKSKLTKMDANIYYLELMSILLNIFRLRFFSQNH